MRLRWGAWKAIGILAGCLMLAVPVLHAQKTSSATAARLGLADKAQALEARGRADLAVQIWQQILLSAPDDPQALAGLARDYKLAGDFQQSDQALAHLRRVRPGDPDIARIQAMSSLSDSSRQLQQAGELAREGRNDEAMRIYRQLYGDNPPDGDIALAYYQTLYGTSGGRQAAVDGMRSLAARNPGDSRDAVQLAVLLTYDRRTRDEGIRILRAHPGDPAAQSALRQALIWDSANPASAAELRNYLKAHPGDQEIAGNLRLNESRLARMNSGIARTPAERAAFAALNAHHLEEAERRFATLLAADPNNGRLAAGMGFVRMQQKNFSGAISYLTQAERNGYKAHSVENALAGSRFWFTMGQGTEALDAGRLNLASSRFRAAVEMNPRSADALNGLAGVYVKQQQYAAAASVYQQLLQVQPASLPGWRGLFLADARSQQSSRALAVAGRLPPSVKAALDKDPEYLDALAGVYQAQNRPADAQRALAQALALPFPASSGPLLAGARLQYAGILMDARRYNQAIALYAQILAADPNSVPAWQGLIGAQHLIGQDDQAIANVQRIPAPAYEAALSSPGFLATLGAIYQQANQLDVAQGFLERAEKLETASGAQPGIALQMQLAGIDLARNNTDQAYAIYRQVLTAHPDRADAWKGLISALAATHRNQEALQEIAQIPPPVRRQLEGDIDFLQTEASLYAATGNTAQAVACMNRVEAWYAGAKQPVPPSVAIQNAWLLYNIGDDRSLYTVLMRLGGRADLTVAQRETVQDIWANWSVRRAGDAMENGDIHRAVDILDAAGQAFPNNLAVRKAVAGGYARVGRAKEALALFKSIPMQDASAGDFEAAIGAALAANDKNQAELWLRQALDRFGRDPAVLELAARYEQARGDNQRAADYYRASLAAMPAVSPTDRLAHTLVYPEQDTRPHRAVTAADLQQLLNPDDEPFARTTRLPPLPAYGPDPYNPAPVLVQPAPPAQSAPQPPPAAVYGPGASNQPWQEPDLTPLPRGARYAPASMLDFHLVRASWSFTRQPAFFASIRAARAVPAAMQASSGAYGQVDIVPNPPHSLASDAWKGLVFSLMAGNRNAEALAEMGRIPPEVRRQLESDVEWVQGVASLYFAVGDTQRATLDLNRVQSYYLVHRAAAPASLELQYAWLLYNMKDDRALYPVLQKLDARQDLTVDQRGQIDSIWADWAVRRAGDAFQSGRTVRGVQLLEAASRDYPDNMTVRLAVAGAYARVGRAQEADTLYKSLNLSDAGSGDLQSAVSAAISAGDMAQAESWLRFALGKYPRDPQILGLAARFEQARGNHERAAAFWRASIAALPPGASVRSLDYGLATPSGTPLRAPGPGETRSLLDPSLDPLPTAQQQAPLPSYDAQTAAGLPAPPLTQAAPSSLVTAPSSQPLPLPADSGYLPGGQGTAPSSQPLYVPQAAGPTPATPSPVLIEQGAASPQYSGTVHLPPSEATVASTGSDDVPRTRPSVNLRIAPEPMGPEAAQTQALLAEQTDSQLTAGSASLIHNLPNAPVNPSPTVPETSAGASGREGYNLAQYTPSAQEAATGAYSAPQQQTPQPAPQAAPPPPAKPHPAVTRRRPRRPRPAPALPPASQAAAPPAEAIAPLQSEPPAPPPQEPETTTSTGLSDEELQQRNLPPLRGPWVRIQRRANPLSPRELAEQQLQAIESSYSGWLGGSALLNYRSGDPGYSQLAAIEAPFEASAPLGYHARITAIAHPVFLDSGQATGNAVIGVNESTITGTSLVAIPEPLGTLTATNVTPPAQQNASGIGGELQIATPTFAIAGGYTPANFLVSTFTGRVMWRPGNGPITLSLTRDSIKDSQLSYAGLRDPAGNTLGSLGQIWGGVVANQGQIQIAHSSADSGFYFAAGGQYITGYNVLNNNRIDGDGGAWWRIFTQPEYGALNVGANFFAMHYQNNQNAFTYGMGGYFSPQAYFLANVPFTWSGHTLNRWHYNVVGAVGVQAFQEDSAPLWPLAVDKPLETAQNSPMLPGDTTVSGNYDFHSEASYQFNPHWFVGGYFAANNSRNYTFTSVGFFVRFLFREQPSSPTTPTGLFPWDGFRPFSVP